MMKILQALKKLNLTNLTKYEMTDRVQISGNLSSGEEIHVMVSGKDWYVGFGKMSPYGTEPMSEEDALQAIEGA